MYGGQELRPKSESCDEGLVNLLWEQVVLWPCVWTLLVDKKGILKSQGTPQRHLSLSLLNTCLCGSSLSSDFAKLNMKLSRMIYT